MNVFYEDFDHRVVEIPEAEHGIHIMVNQNGFWCVGIWDGKALVKSLIDEINRLKISLEAEKTKRII